MTIALPVIGQVVSKSTFGDPVVNALNTLVTSSATWNALPLGVVARANRTTTSTTFTNTEIGVLRIDNIPITSGRHYLIYTTGFIFNSTVAADLIELNFHVSTAGAATTGSTQAEGAAVQSARSAAGAQYVTAYLAHYVSATTGTLSVLLGAIRSAGTGTCSLVSSSGKYSMNILIIDMGVAPSDTGVDI